MDENKRNYPLELARLYNDNPNPVQWKRFFRIKSEWLRHDFAWSAITMLENGRAKNIDDALKCVMDYYYANKMTIPFEMIKKEK